MVYKDKEYRLEEFLLWIENLAADTLDVTSVDALTKREFLLLAIEAADIVGCADCAICSVDCCAIEEYYMVTNDLWRQHGVRHGMLCVECFESRMGRELQPRDFMPSAADNQPGRQHSDRLRNRLGLA